MGIAAVADSRLEIELRIAVCAFLEKVQFLFYACMQFLHGDSGVGCVLDLVGHDSHEISKRRRARHGDDQVKQTLS